ncbi:MAG: hypothetical protein ABIZ04_18025 [Opitutus sp.]
MKIALTVLLVAFVATACTQTAIAPPKATVARFFLELIDQTDATLVLPRSETRINVAAKPVFTEYDIADVEVAHVELGQCLLFQLTPAAARDLNRLSAANAGRRLVLTIDGRPMGARRIDRTFDEGSLLVFAEVPDEELPALQSALRKTARTMQASAPKK